MLSPSTISCQLTRDAVTWYTPGATSRTSIRLRLSNDPSGRFCHRRLVPLQDEGFDTGSVGAGTPPGGGEHRSIARQMQLIHLADAMQLPNADGCRSMREWVAGRLDISREAASSLTTTAKRLADLPDLAQQLAEGRITFDRATATSRIPGEH
ncbi:MAG: DUF222 domain-containing protein [Actinobacteria bacterium]|nr:DUF222 domain-containing protein [Actinomycetota bacterium]